MNAHSALSLPDIARCIVEQTWSLPLVDRRLLLVNLAQVNKIFRDPAERMLWREMTSLAPLYKVLPEHIVIETSAPAVPAQRVQQAGMARVRRRIMDPSEIMNELHYDLVSKRPLQSALR